MLSEEFQTAMQYPNYSDDPEPPPADSFRTTLHAYDKELKEYTSKVSQAYVKSRMKGATLWCDFVASFRREIIRTWHKPTVIAGVDLLITDT